MARLVLCFALFCAFSSVEAKIIETQHVADAIPYIDENTWFLVDLDNTMYQGKQALGHANWFYDLLQDKLKEGLTKEQALIAIYPEWVRTQKLCPVKALEEDFVPLLKDLQKRHIVVMGFTHRQPPVAEATIRQIASLNFDFLPTAPSKDSFSVPAKGGPTIYLKGVLFVGDYNKKGDVFVPFFNVIKQKPTKVVFIDDKKKNVEEMEETMHKEGIDYVGIYYTAIEHTPPVYSRALADFQYQFLDTLMSNETAEILLKHSSQ